ncbi:MAG: hypothetical protein JSV68_17555 [Anaerolineaceae bacterium]|nr:MAG: hypothetical protein JSV68_17555 [Anaerolineaceae bacterium]
MTRLWPKGDLIKVLGEKEGAPDRLIWQGQMHPIAHVTRRWRVQIEWWREPLWRDYFKLTTETGLLLIIYHDLHEGNWYVQRLYD